MSNLSTVVVPGSNSASYQSSYWLALALTQGLGPTRIKKLIEHNGTAERVFQASLTELEATGRRRFRAIAGYGKVARIGAAGMREGGRGGRQDYFAQRS
jgi:hypothetical protein